MLPDADVLYDSLVARDGRFDGPAFICVKTTGIYCRFGCPARTPLRRNVEFRQTAEDCVAAGFRACKRCHPDDPLGASLRKFCAGLGEKRPRES
jgi:AraC family transcriptional regulator of adaptative response/methylated-DNA-[protein]-cysteine methyltransferase